MKVTINYDGNNYSIMPKKFIQNIYGMKLFFIIYDDADNLVDITGRTINFQIREIGSTTSKVDVPCVITDPVNGECEYTLASTDLDTTGVYESELEITEGVTYKNIIKLGMFGVREEL